jgi:threonine/homoserine/homoserine lactone efflux protein
VRDNFSMPAMTTLLVFAATTLLLVATPGPGVLYIVGRSADLGRRAGLISMLAVESAEVVYVVAAALGVSAALAASAQALQVLRFGGATYLIVLGLRRWRNAGSSDSHASQGPRRTFAQGFVVQLLNPKVALFFIAYFPQFLNPRRAVAPQVLLLGCIYIAIAAVSDSIYVVASAYLARRFTHNARSNLVLGRVSALLYVALGLYAALTGDRARAAGIS